MEQNYEHKHIEDFVTTDNGGVLLIFEDKSHTYITPDLLTSIVYESYIKLMDPDEEE